jgi:hypothetical protein
MQIQKTSPKNPICRPLVVMIEVELRNQPPFCLDFHSIYILNENQDKMVVGFSILFLSKK